MTAARFIVPDWPAPAQVFAVSTTCHSGDMGDAHGRANTNRTVLRRELELPGEPLWLRQVHGSVVVPHGDYEQPASADGSYTDTQGLVCAVLTADCVPVLLCNRQGTEVAALHAGWRGLVAGVLQSGLAAMSSPADELLAWLGPGICAAHYEVGTEVRDAFVEILHQPADLERGFRWRQAGKWSADLAALTASILAHQGVQQIYAYDGCTFGDTKQFYSYRRDKPTGRQASLIWLRED